MKYLIIALTAVTLFTANQAKALTINHSAYTILSFQNKGNGSIIIRNAEGKIIHNKKMSSRNCNFGSETFLPGNYSYTIINGNATTLGSFNVI